MRKWNDDPYTKRAQRENFEARSVYKLEEIDKREQIIRSAKRIVDLGAAPGSWVQYCLKANPNAHIFAIDRSPLNVKDPRVTFLQSDIESVDLASFLGERVDVVLSDLAPKTSGIPDRDVALSFELASTALDCCKKWLLPNGSTVIKLFMGESFEEFQQHMKSSFSYVRLLRPDSTRKHSREIYFVGKGFSQST